MNDHTHQANQTLASVSATAVLKAIVEVEPERRVRCQHEGCSRTVYRAVHVVEDGGRYFVLGSQCFATLFGSAKALGDPAYQWGGSGRTLSDAERQMLANNTADLIAQFEKERLQREAQYAARLVRMEEILRSTMQHLSTQSRQVPGLPARTANDIPFDWAVQGASVAYIVLRDGTAWVRVRHKSNLDFLCPWPHFDGWNEALPTVVGNPDVEIGAYALPDTARAIKYLREHAVQFTVNSWRYAVPKGR